MLGLEKREVGDGEGELLLAEGVVRAFLVDELGEHLGQPRLQLVAVRTDELVVALAIDVVDARLRVVLDLVGLLLSVTRPGDIILGVWLPQLSPWHNTKTWKRMKI